MRRRVAPKPPQTYETAVVQMLDAATRVVGAAVSASEHNAVSLLIDTENLMRVMISVRRIARRLRNEERTARAALAAAPAPSAATVAAAARAGLLL